jgi:hypothetical protein
MTMTLSQADIWELYETTDFVETELAADFYEVKGKAPQLLGDGHFWEIDLCEGIWLGISTWTNPNVCTIACEERQHEVEITLWIPTRRQNSHYTPSSAVALHPRKSGNLLPIGKEYFSLLALSQICSSECTAIVPASYHQNYKC